jgi:phosphatidate phosphatase APP1
VRFHGNVFKQPNISQSQINDLANKFLIDTSVEELPPSQSAQAVNLTREIYVVQQANQNVTFHLEPAPSAGGDGESGGGGAIPATGGAQQVKFPVPTTDQGDYDAFVQIESNGLLPGNGTSQIQRLNVYTDGTSTGNATAYLVPTSGFTVISDIDDILRVTKIYQPKEGLLNSFARPYTPWRDMPDIYANWSRSLPDLHFHYLTTTPEQVSLTERMVKTSLTYLCR